MNLHERLQNEIEQRDLHQKLAQAFAEKIEITKRQIALEEIDDGERLSECCGAGPENDEGLCPSCHDHCRFMTEDELDAEMGAS